MDTIEDRLAYETQDRLGITQRVVELEAALVKAEATIQAIADSQQIVADALERHEMFLFFHTRHHEQVEGSRYVGEALNQLLDKSLAARGAARMAERNFNLGVSKDGQ
jgi:hypothetical protein